MWSTNISVALLTKETALTEHKIFRFWEILSWVFEDWDLAYISEDCVFLLKYSESNYKLSKWQRSLSILLSHNQPFLSAFASSQDGFLQAHWENFIEMGWCGDTLVHPGDLSGWESRIEKEWTKLTAKALMKHRHRRNVTSHHSFSVHGLFQLLWILSKDNFYHFFLLSLEVETISLLITFIVRKLLSLYKFYQVLWLINFYH